MIHQLANLLRKVSALESEREKEKKEISTLHNLLKDFNKRVKKIEDIQVTNTTNLETTKTMVTQMLSEVPQVSSIEERFEAMEEKIQEYSLPPCEADKTSSHDMSFELRLNELEKNFACIKPQSDIFDSVQINETSSMNYPDATSIAEIATELEERNKRRKSLVIHNLPESSNHEDEVTKVSALIEEILHDHHNFEFETEEPSRKPRLYRLGTKTRQKVRTLKVHLKYPETRDHISRHP